MKSQLRRFHSLRLMITSGVLPVLILSACAPDPLAIPGPSRAVTRAEAMAIAHAYTALQWMPEDRHVRHGPDRQGILVHTPDHSLSQHGYPGGWWKPDTTAIGMPYQWGGFDTPRSFLNAIARGEKAGDIATAEKRRLIDDAVSKDSAGIDCSGFVSRCWRLQRPYSTRELPSICDPLDDWDQLEPGDILLKQGHVLLFRSWLPGRKKLQVYEAGIHPAWRVNRNSLRVTELKREGYRAWRYRRMLDS